MNKFKRDFEITEEFQNLIIKNGEKYVEKIFFKEYCQEIINSIKNKLNLEIEITKSTKQELNEENELTIIPISVFRFSIDQIIITNLIKKEKVGKKTNPTPCNGETIETKSNEKSNNNEEVL